MPNDHVDAPEPEGAGTPATEPTTIPDGQPSDGTNEVPAATPPRSTAAQAMADVRRHAARAWPYLRWPVYGFGALVLVVVAVGAWVWTTTELPETPSVAASAVLLDRDGNELAILAQEGLRLEVSLDEVAPVVTDALVAAEDQRFFDHTGIDPVGIGRALWKNVTESGTQGGSTLTQQLVKNTYLTSERTVTRKVREAVLAIKLERTQDKDEILERYLNTVYFGRGAYGIEAAARTWFDSTAAELTAPQAALLTGMLRAPESLDPAEEPDAARERRDAVLQAMASMGTLTVDEAEAARAEPVQVQPADPSPTILRAGVAPHFVEHVRNLLIDEFGEQALYDQGLVVHTTLDLADQRAAEAAVAAHLDDPTEPQAAVVAVDRSGAVRAWVGGRDFESLQVDLVSDAGGAGRQPGSTFKPITLAAHLEAGNGAAQRYPAPSEISLDVGADEPWEVSNAGGSGYGSLTLADATVNSVNTVYAQVVEELGAGAVVDMANRLGVDRELEPHPSIALGAQEVSPLEMATVYSTLARSGTRIDPFVMTSVETRGGETLWELGDVEATEAVAPGVADTVSAILEETPRRGTARRAALDRPMAAKTGTTQNNADAWLAGYTPEYTTIVWVGNAGSNEPMADIDGVAVQGGTIPAAIWRDFMVEALADVPPTEFPEPDAELLSGRSQRSERARVDVSDGDGDGDATTTTTSSTTSSSTTSSTTSTTEPAEDGDGDGDGGDTSTTTTTAPATTTTTAAPTTTTEAATATGTEETASADGGGG